MSEELSPLHADRMNKTIKLFPHSPENAGALSISPTRQFSINKPIPKSEEPLRDHLIEVEDVDSPHLTKLNNNKD